MDYELVEAQDCFDDDNGGLIYGIHWIDDEDGEVEPYDRRRYRLSREDPGDTRYAGQAEGG